MNIETARTLLTPMTEELITAVAARDIQGIESLGYSINDEWPEKDLKEALPVFKGLIKQNGVNGFGAWIIILKESGMVIGSTGFIGNPANGRIELGFGIIPSMRRKGYCYEAARAITTWGMQQERVCTIVAHCNDDNEESMHMLTRLGFTQVGRDKALISWEYSKPLH
jgi:[ribosomal protein S5]-alanine N-acetyltransferase